MKGEASCFSGNLVLDRFCDWIGFIAFAILGLLGASIPASNLLIVGILAEDLGYRAVAC